MESRCFSATILTGTSQPKAFQWVTFSQMSYSLCCAWKWRQNSDDPWQNFASPTHTPWAIQGDEANPEAIYAEWKTSSSEANCHWFAWHGHISGLDFRLRHKLSFSSRDEDSVFQFNFPPVKWQDHSDLQFWRQRDLGCSFYRLLCAIDATLIWWQLASL